MSAELLMVEQRGAQREGPTWILEGGRRLRGMDDRRRIAELRNGLVCHGGRARASPPTRRPRTVERALAELHEPEYLKALHGLRSEQPVTMPELSPPGLPPDVPVSAGARRRRPRGRAHGDRGGGARWSRAPASPTRSAARPATTPGPTGSPATATSTRPRRRR